MEDLLLQPCLLLSTTAFSCFNKQRQVCCEDLGQSAPGMAAFTKARTEVRILNDFSLNVLAGKTIALVGSSGSGKSTVVSLIERFYDPTSGQVMLDGHDIKTLKLRCLRQQTGMVSQEPALFATTFEKIYYWAGLMQIRLRLKKQLGLLMLIPSSSNFLNVMKLRYWGHNFAEITGSKVVVEFCLLRMEPIQQGFIQGSSPFENMPAVCRES